MERRKWRKGMQGQSEIKSMGKCWLRSATGLCAVTYLSACRDVKHTPVPMQRFYAELVVCRLQKTWSFGAYQQAPKMYELKESRSSYLFLDLGSLFFLLLQESSLLAELSCCVPVMHTSSPDGVPGCRFVPLLISWERWPGSVAVQATVNYHPAGNPEQSCCWFWEELGNGIPETWPKSLLFSMLVCSQNWRGTSSLFPASFLKQRRSQRWVEITLSCLDKINQQMSASLISWGVVHQVAITLDGLSFKRIASDCRHLLSKQ